jgi:hypothetical protein
MPLWLDTEAHSISSIALFGGMRNRHTARLRKKEEIFSYNAD